MSIENALAKVSLMRREPGLSLEAYTAAVQAMSPQDLEAEVASVRRQLSPPRWNALSQAMQNDFGAKFDVLRELAAGQGA